LFKYNDLGSLRKGHECYFHDLFLFMVNKEMHDISTAYPTLLILVRSSRELGYEPDALNKYL